MGDEPRESLEDDNTMGKSNKRLRVSQACEPCRLKKGKCDGRQPRCTVCKRHGIECSYDPKPRRRGLRPGQYSALERRAMLAELIAAFLMSKTPDAEENLGSFFCFQDPDLPFLAPGPKQVELDELLDRWKKGPVSQWLLETAARTDPTLDQMSRLKSNRSAVAASLPMVSLDDQNSQERPNAQSPRPASADPEGDVNKKFLSETNKGLHPLPNNLDELFETYFAYTHTWLPLIDKFKLTAFAHNSSSMPQYASELTTSQSANLALTWAVVSYASLREMGEDQPDCANKPTVNSIEAASESLSLVPAFDANMSYEHAQALIILSLFFFECGGHRTSWLLIGLAGRVSVDLSTVAPGQHLPSIARRTSLACFVVEGIIGAALDRKPQIHTLRSRNQVHSKGFSPENAYELEAEGWEEWSGWDMPGCKSSSSAHGIKEPFRVLSIFNHMVGLVEILNMAALHFDPSTSAGSPKVPIDPCMDGPSDLTTWAYRISDSHPSLAPNNIANATLPHVINLHALYLLIRCICHLQNNLLKHEKQQYSEMSHQLASTINDLATKYQSAYPMNPIPMALMVSIMTAMRLSGPEDSVRKSLSKILSTGPKYQDATWGKADVLRLGQPAGGKLHSSFNATDIFPGRNRKWAKANMSSYTFPQLPPHANIPASGEYGYYTSPNQAPPDAVMEMSGTMDMDVMGIDIGDTSSLSAHDLTVLDAAVWNDKLLTRNLGFMEDSQTALDPELSHLFDPFSQNLT